MVTPFINETGTIGIIYQAATTNITGSEFITLMGLILIILAFFMAFRLPIEVSAVLVIPFMLICMAYSNNIFAVAGVFILYTGILIAKNYFVN